MARRCCVGLCAVLVAGLALAGGPPRRGRPRPPGPQANSLAKTPTEKRILEVLEDMRLHQSRGMANVPKEDGRLLRVVTEVVGAKRVVEIGTSNGYSGLWFCLALRATGGKLTTFEIDPEKVRLATANFKRAGVDDIATIVQGDAHQTVTRIKEPIDVLFLDADKSGYIDYLQKLLPLVRPGGLVIAHNMVYPRPDPRYIRAITTNPDLETLFVHMDGPGIAVSMKKRPIEEKK